MVKRKPDPQTQHLRLLDVPSEIIHLFKDRAKADYDKSLMNRPDYKERFEELCDQHYSELSSKEKKAVLTDYFCKLVYETAERTAMFGIEFELRNYRNDQAGKREEWEVRKPK